MASIRDSAVDAFRAAVASITRANGYSEDLGVRVYDFDAAPQNAITPCALLHEGEEAVVERQWYRYTRTLALSVLGVVAYSGADPAGKARELIADIQRACGLAYSITVPLREPPNGPGGTGSVRVEVRELGSAANAGGLEAGRVYVQVNFEVAYVTSRDDPRAH